jgi:exodeoxyribonuclease VII large subunit
VGHETDTTLIDFVSDQRAPTPTAAAELATPVLADLKVKVLGFEQRMLRCARHVLETRSQSFEAAARRLPRPEALLALQAQRFDLASGRLAAALSRNVDAHERDLIRTSSRFTPGLVQRPCALKAQRLAGLGARLESAGGRTPLDAARRARLPDLDRRLAAALVRRIDRSAERLAATDQLLRSLNPKAPLARGYALVHRADGSLARTANVLNPGEAVTLQFADASRDARIEGGVSQNGPAPLAQRPTASKRKPAQDQQGDLF